MLTPLQTGPLKRDSGTMTGALPAERIVTRYRAEYVDGGNGSHVGIGSWNVVRGTGQYAPEHRRWAEWQCVA